MSSVGLRLAHQLSKYSIHCLGASFPCVFFFDDLTQPNAALLSVRQVFECFHDSGGKSGWCFGFDQRLFPTEILAMRGCVGGDDGKGHAHVRQELATALSRRQLGRDLRYPPEPDSEAPANKEWIP